MLRSTFALSSICVNSALYPLGLTKGPKKALDTDISERQSFSNSVLEEHLDSGLEGHADRPSFQDIESGVGIESGAGARAGDEPTNSLRLPDLSEGEEKISDVEENNSSQSRLKTISLCASPALAFEAIEKGSYPKEPSISDIKLTSAERDAWLDLRMYLDRAPFTSSLTRAAFRKRIGTFVLWACATSCV